MRWNGLGFILLILLAAARGWADADFNSSIDLKAISFPIQISPAVNDQLYQADIKMGLVSQGDTFKFTGKLNYVADPSNKSIDEQNFFDAPELNLKAKVGDFLFKAGTDIYNWGVTDGFNPIDLVNTRNYYDPFHSRKLGAGSVSINYSKSWFEMDLIGIPAARPSQLPGVNSRWLPRQIYISNTAAGPGVELHLPSQFNYTYLGRQNLGQPLTNNAGARLQAHLDNLELAFYGYDGVAQVPIISPTVSGSVIGFKGPLQVIQVNSGVQLLLQDYRQTTGGASFTYTRGSWQLKGEGEWTQPSQEASAVQGWSDAGVLGVEKTWAVGTSGSLVTLVQYSSGNHAKVPGNDLSSFGDFFNSNGMAGVHFTWRDNDTITAFYSYDFLTTSWLGDLSYSRRLSDNWTISAGGTTMDGPNTSPLGVYTANKSVYADLGWSY